MAELSPRTESTEGERHSLPVAVSAQADQPESWFTRVMRVLFGWRAPSPRADLELVLTAEPAQSDFSPEEAAMLKNILGLRETRIERIMVPRADIVAVQQDITLGELVKV
ncbi:MAG TPA: magnesium/cobalt efflux protein, partial [Xanthobacteraceae bacterium]